MPERATRAVKTKRPDHKFASNARGRWATSGHTASSASAAGAVEADASAPHRRHLPRDADGPIEGCLVCRQEIRRRDQDPLARRPRLSRPLRRPKGSSEPRPRWTRARLCVRPQAFVDCSRTGWYELGLCFARSSSAVGADRADRLGRRVRCSVFRCGAGSPDGRVTLVVALGFGASLVPWRPRR